jgi:hypothetical protein
MMPDIGDRDGPSLWWHLDRIRQAKEAKP